VSEAEQAEHAKADAGRVDHREARAQLDAQRPAVAQLVDLVE